MINGILSQFSLKYAFASQAATAESDNCGMTQQMHSCSFKYIRQKYKYGHEKAKEPCTRVRAQAELVIIQVTTTENKEVLGNGGAGGERVGTSGCTLHGKET